MIESRQQRTFGVTASLTPGDRAELVMLRMQPGWRVLLDVLEMVCIEQEGALVNAPVDKPETILAEHRKSQAMWQAFEFMQEKVDAEVRVHDASILPASKTNFTPEQLRRDQLLDPTRHYDPNPTPRP